MCVCVSNNCCLCATQRQAARGLHGPRDPGAAARRRLAGLGLARAGAGARAAGALAALPHAPSRAAAAQAHHAAGT